MGCCLLRFPKTYGSYFSGINLSPASSSAGASSGIANIWGATRARKTDLAPLSHVAVLRITRGPPERPALAVEIPAEVKHRFRLHDARSWVVRPEWNEFVRLTPICLGCRVPPTLPLPPAWLRSNCS